MRTGVRNLGRRRQALYRFYGGGGRVERGPPAPAGGSGGERPDRKVLARVPERLLLPASGGAGGGAAGGGADVRRDAGLFWQFGHGSGGGGNQAGHAPHRPDALYRLYGRFPRADAGIALLHGEQEHPAGGIPARGARSPPALPRPLPAGAAGKARRIVRRDGDPLPGTRAVPNDYRAGRSRGRARRADSGRRRLRSARFRLLPAPAGDLRRIWHLADRGRDPEWRRAHRALVGD